MFSTNGRYTATRSHTWKPERPFASVTRDVYAIGSWGHESMKANGKKVKIGLGVVAMTNSINSVLALGNGNRFVNDLYDAGVIRSRTYSISLSNSAEAHRGEVLFGGLDQAHSEEMKIVPIVEEHKLVVPLTDMRFGDFKLENETVVELNTGSSKLHAPKEIIDQPLVQFSANGDTWAGTPIISCLNGDDNRKLRLNFRSHIIKVAFSELVSVFGSLCMLNVHETDRIVFGNGILKSLYITVDLNNQEIGLARARSNTERNVEVIGKSKRIPRPKAEGYDKNPRSNNLTRTMTRNATRTTSGVFSNGPRYTGGSASIDNYRIYWYADTTGLPTSIPQGDVDIGNEQKNNASLTRVTDRNAVAVAALTLCCLLLIL